MIFPNRIKIKIIAIFAVGYWLLVKQTHSLRVRLTITPVIKREKADKKNLHHTFSLFCVVCDL